MKQQTLTLTGIPFPFCADTAMDDHSDRNALAALRQSLRTRSARTPGARMTGADFMQYMARHIPEAHAFIEQDDIGHAHLEMGAMRLATRDAIDRDDFQAVYRHFSVIGGWLGYAEDELFDAIIVSYLEALFVGNAAPEYRNARGLLPLNLEEALQKIEQHFARLEPGHMGQITTAHMGLAALAPYSHCEHDPATAGAVC